MQYLVYTANVNGTKDPSLHRDRESLVKLVMENEE